MLCSFKSRQRGDFSYRGSRPGGHWRPQCVQPVKRLAIGTYRVRNSTILPPPEVCSVPRSGNMERSRFHHLLLLGFRYFNWTISYQRFLINALITHFIPRNATVLMNRYQAGGRSRPRGLRKGTLGIQY